MMAFIWLSPDECFYWLTPPDDIHFHDVEKNADIENDLKTLSAPFNRNIHHNNPRINEPISNSCI
jgi:hypothetical protein